MMKLNLAHSIMKNISSANPAASMSFKSGQIITGKIIKAFQNNLALLQVGSIKMVAELEAQLEVQSTYLLQVTSDSAKLKLKVIEQVKDNQLMDSKALSNQLLNLFHVENNPQSKNIINYFLDQNLPLSHDLITKTIEWMKGSQNFEMDLNVINQLIKRDLPFTFETFKALRSFENGTQISASLTNLSTLIPDSEQKERLMQIIQNEPIDPLKPSTEIAKMLKKMILGLGLQHEHDILNLGNKQTDFKFDTLKPLLIDIKNTYANSDVKETANMILEKLTSMQLLSESAGPMQQYVMQIPLQLGGEFKDLTIQWSGKRDKNDTIDLNFCRIIFYLDLKLLKETMLDVQIQNRVINVTVVNDTVGLNEIIDRLKPELKESLGKLEFTLSSVKIVKKPLLQQSNKKNTFFHSNHYSGVDIRV